ncbi:hypothetical protein [Sporosarcina sp. FSL K6-3508]|uniref:hypothetical protein n=1 Tax=Sporosarcina sp. FSL K6-3508 TaxID=2921557 RepID=UPI003159DC86
MDQHAEHHHYQYKAQGESEVTANVTYRDAIITIELKDKHGKTPELGVSHEKEMHLIVVSADLKEYIHGHPEKQADGVYMLQRELRDNDYKIFVDIAPKNLSYTVSPITLHVGHAYHPNHGNELKVDTDFVKMVDGYSVELKANNFEAGQDISLLFDLRGATPEPYLGALGHVVILDENAEHFIHVHPVSDDKTQFKTVLTEAGKYKLWAEFQFDGEVYVYAYVIEIK